MILIAPTAPLAPEPIAAPLAEVLALILVALAIEMSLADALNPEPIAAAPFE